MNDKGKRILYVLTDYLSTLLALAIFCVVRYNFVDTIQERFHGDIDIFLHTRGVFLTFCLFPPFMLLLYYLSGYYIKVNFKSRVKELFSTILSTAVGSICFFMVVLLNDVLPSRISNYKLLLLFFAILLIVVYIPRYVLTTLLLSRSRRSHPHERMLFIGNQKQFQEISPQSLGRNRRFIGQQINIDTVNSKPQAETIKSILQEQLINKGLLDEFDSFYVALPESDKEGWLNVIGELFRYEKPIYVNSDEYRVLTSRVVIDDVLSEPLTDISRTEQSDFLMALKRANDVLFSTLALIISSPIIGAFALIVRLTSKGPAFFSQERIGYHRKPFKLFKLRSMYVDAESSGPALSHNNDKRVTPIGRIMRKYRIDELPNFWNVLKGDLSLVGPRPEREFYLKQMREKAPYCTLLHQLRPGLTSLGMVKFGYASNVDEMLKRLRYDLMYIQNISPALDLRIIIYTVRAIVRGEGK